MWSMGFTRAVIHSSFKTMKLNLNCDKFRCQQRVRLVPEQLELLYLLIQCKTNQSATYT